MQVFLREWRQDALNRHQYDAAIAFADKALAMTGDDQDAFWLAQVQFTTGNYDAARLLLANKNLIERTPQSRYLAAHCYIKQGKVDDALRVLGDKNPTHLISTPGSARTKLRHVDVNSRAGSRHHKSGTRTDRVPTSEERDHEDIDNLKSEAGMCFLRGTCYAKLNSFDRAKECYKTAVQIDVQNYEAFDALMRNNLMSPAEEWTFLDSLNFDMINVSNNPSLSQEAAQFTKTFYTTRLSKYTNPEAFSAATETLSTHYNLGNNADILLAKSDLMFTMCRFRDALALTSSVLAEDKYNFAILPIHIACLHELGEKNTLYMLSHQLTESQPSEPCSWLAVGAYYLCIGKIAEARRYFSKSSMMDPHFGPAWIGFAHTFAAEGEHDQAISAYSTAARLFQGTHLPQLFLGMQNLQLNNIALSREYFKTAYSLCSSDPLLLNELGVVYYHDLQLSDSITFFRRAIANSDANGADPDAALPIKINLGHALRKAGEFEDSLSMFDSVLRHGVKDAAVFTAKGIVLLELGRIFEAAVVFHEALAVSPQDAMATDMLSRALAVNEVESAWGLQIGGPELEHVGGTKMLGERDDEELDELDRRMHGKLKEIEMNRVAGRRGRRRRGAARDEEESTYGESMVVDSDEG
ncbi:hypothetical protein IAQ61_003405 [Plenodomus lingam]|uniref:uncharacterized protein n=1 Tax=Leptosphaeria maculans TaxID=5022 RepID=UPI00331B328F|nr:hypothetical protein IAQ61_003405 [Plenodomus lingam]